MSTFRIRECFDEIDLRFVTARRKFLRDVARTYQLRSGECVVYTNTALTRFRLVLRIQGAVFLCIPEIDMDSKRSVYLHISEELSRLAGKAPRIKLEEIKKITVSRIKKRKDRDHSISTKKSEKVIEMRRNFRGEVQ
jgi:hypothetical protein